MQHFLNLTPDRLLVLELGAEVIPGCKVRCRRCALTARLRVSRVSRVLRVLRALAHASSVIRLSG